MDWTGPSRKICKTKSPTCFTRRAGGGAHERARRQATLSDHCPHPLPRDRQPFPLFLACDPPPTRTPSVGEGWKRAQQIEVWPPPRRQIYKSQEAISKSRLMQNGKSTSGCSVCTICDRIVGDRMNDQDSNHLTTTGCTVSEGGKAGEGKEGETTTT